MGNSRQYGAMVARLCIAQHVGKGTMISCFSRPASESGLTVQMHFARSAELLRQAVQFTL